MAPALLIIVLHYSGLEDTLECLASLATQSYDNVHTIVIDNGSVDRPSPRIEADFPWAELIVLPENLGWSGGNNLGIRLGLERGADVMCLLNNDTVLPADAMARLMATAGSLGPCVLHPAIDSYFEGDQVQLDPTIPEPAALTTSPVEGRPGVFKIDMINGACLCVHAAVFRAIGLIDERYFLLCEDGDFGRRAVDAGFSMYCDTTVRIKHKESRAFGGRRRPIKTYYGIRNQLLFYETHDLAWSSLWTELRAVIWTLSGTADAAGAPARSGFGLLRWLFSADVFARAARMGLRDYALRRFGRVRAQDGAVLTGR